MRHVIILCDCCVNLLPCSACRERCVMLSSGCLFGAGLYYPFRPNTGWFDFHNYWWHHSGAETPRCPVPTAFLLSRCIDLQSSMCHRDHAGECECSKGTFAHGANINRSSRWVRDNGLQHTCMANAQYCYVKQGTCDDGQPGATVTSVLCSLIVLTESLT